jgi:hypothetical protein
MLSVLFAFLLAGCGEKEDDTSVEPEEATEEVVSEEDTAGEEETEEGSEGSEGSEESEESGESEGEE